MRIGELSKQSGLSREAIRFYERSGLMRQIQRSGDNGYRLYGKSALVRLKSIARLQRMGFSLEEIGVLLPKDYGQSTAAAHHMCQNLPDQITQKLELIEQKLELLQTYKTRLIQTLEACESAQCGNESRNTMDETADELPSCFVASPI